MTSLRPTLAISIVIVLIGCNPDRSSFDAALAEIRELGEQQGSGSQDESVALARQLVALSADVINDNAGNPRQLAEVYAHRGNALIILGEIPDALSNLSEAVQLAPEQAEYWALRAYVNGLMDNKAAAIDDLGHAVAIDPENSLYLADRALLLEEIGDVAGAIRDYSAAIASDPDTPDLLEYRADSYAGLGNYAAAAVDYREAIRIAQAEHGRLFGTDSQDYDPTELEIRVKLGAAYERQGEWENALGEYETVLALEPGNTKAKEGRERLASD